MAANGLKMLKEFPLEKNPFFCGGDFNKLKFGRKDFM
jgi:hypothetical protein